MQKKRKAYFDIFGAIALVTVFVFTAFSTVTSQSALSGMKLCAFRLIPTVFPILVLNGIIMKSGFAHKISKHISRPLTSLYGISPCSAVAVLLGIVCGCPSGSVPIGMLLENGEINESDATIALILSSSVSAGFIIGTVGGVMLQDTRKGVAIWLIQLLSAFIVCLFLRKKTILNNSSVNVATVGSLDLGSCIKEASESMLVISGTVIFFSTIGGIISSVYVLPNELRGIIISALEITSGTAYVAENFSKEKAFVLLCAVSGWSGISMHCQVTGILKGKLKMKKYVFAKLLCSFLSSLLGLLLVKIGIF